MQMLLGKESKMKIRMIHQPARSLKCQVIMTLLKQEQLLNRKAHHLIMQVCVHTVHVIYQVCPIVSRSFYLIPYQKILTMS